MLKKALCWRLAGGGFCLVLLSGSWGQSRLIQVPVTGYSHHSLARTDATEDDPGISGPVLGFVSDDQKGLRPIFGVPGAVSWGETIPLPEGDVLTVSAQRSYALVATAGDGELLIVSDLLGATTFSAVTGVNGNGFDQAATSPGETTVALYDRDTGLLQVLQGLPESPVPSWDFSLKTLPAAVSAISVSDDGQAVLAIAGAEDERFLALLAPGVNWRYLTALRGQASASFLRNKRDVVVSESRTNQVTLIRDVTGAADISILAGETQGVSSPVAATVSWDQQRVVVVNSAPSGLLVLSPLGGVTVLPCPCSPKQVRKMNGHAVFLLNDPLDDMLWLADGDSVIPRIVCVPRQVEVESKPTARRAARGSGRRR